MWKAHISHAFLLFAPLKNGNNSKFRNKGCRPHLRSPHAALKHLLDEHANLNETTHSLPSPLLKPSWKPFFPSTIPEPPPVPQDPGPGCVLVSTSANTLRNRKGFTPLPLSSQAIFPGASPRKQSKQIPKVLPEDDDLDVPDFGQLPRYRWDDVYWSNEIIVWRPPAMFNMDIARPQRMLDGLPSETPRSISYEVFAKQVNGLECKGLL
ncbi:hypothetical protein C0995_011910 [Termitomyces sp. Mi166|nr:hypothetical protein C0995_011910 [Termitomyces sp. Mi166\